MRFQLFSGAGASSSSALLSSLLLAQLLASGIAAPLPHGDGVQLGVSDLSTRAALQDDLITRSLERRLPKGSSRGPSSKSPPPVKQPPPPPPVKQPPPPPPVKQPPPPPPVKQPPPPPPVKQPPPPPPVKQPPVTEVTTRPTWGHGTLQRIGEDLLQTGAGVILNKMIDGVLMQINSETGAVIGPVPVDPATAQPVTPPAGETVAPVDGQQPPSGGDQQIDPATGLPIEAAAPITEPPVDVQQ